VVGGAPFRDRGTRGAAARTLGRAVTFPQSCRRGSEPIHSRLNSIPVTNQRNRWRASFAASFVRFASGDPDSRSGIGVAAADIGCDGPKWRSHRIC
jgi:hypothetical protein